MRQSDLCNADPELYPYPLELLILRVPAANAKEFFATGIYAKVLVPRC